MTLDEGLSRAVRESRTGTPRFRFPISAEDAYRLLYASYDGEVRFRMREPEFDEFTLDKLWQMSLYITSPQSKFGMLMCGSVGNGKTTMLHAFRRAVILLNKDGYFKAPDYDEKETFIQIHTAKSLVRLAKSDWKEFGKICDKPLLAIDELGEEPREVMDYGNILSPMVDLIEHRYNKQLFTLVTSNLAPGKMGEVYGERVGDRFREMLEILNYKDGKSFR